MKKHKTKAAPRLKATKAPNDMAVIRECVIYAQSIAAKNSDFKADSDLDNKNAVALGTRHSAQARRALTKITTMTASTPAGLQSKARILPMVIEDSAGSMEDFDELFFRSFAANVKAFLEPLIRSAWAADKAAAKAKAEVSS